MPVIPQLVKQPVADRSPVSPAQFGGDVAQAAGQLSHSVFGLSQTFIGIAADDERIKERKNRQDATTAAMVASGQILDMSEKLKTEERDFEKYSARHSELRDQIVQSNLDPLKGSGSEKFQTLMERSLADSDLALNRYGRELDIDHSRAGLATAEAAALATLSDWNKRESWGSTMLNMKRAHDESFSDDGFYSEKQSVEMSQSFRAQAEATMSAAQDHGFTNSTVRAIMSDHTDGKSRINAARTDENIPENLRADVLRIVEHEVRIDKNLEEERVEDVYEQNLKLAITGDLPPGSESPDLTGTQLKSVNAARAGAQKGEIAASEASVYAGVHATMRNNPEGFLQIRLSKLELSPSDYGFFRKIQKDLSDGDSSSIKRNSHSKAMTQFKRLIGQMEAVDDLDIGKGKKRSSRVDELEFAYINSLNAATARHQIKNPGQPLPIEIEDRLMKEVIQAEAWEIPDSGFFFNDDVLPMRMSESQLVTMVNAPSSETRDDIEATMFEESGQERWPTRREVTMRMIIDFQNQGGAPMSAEQIRQLVGKK